MGSVDEAINDWVKRVNKKTDEIVTNVDKSLVKAAFFCEGEAKKNAMERIYNEPIPINSAGRPWWKRTGLYKASIGSGMDPSKSHSAIVFDTAPYAKIIEYGDSNGRRGRYILTDAVIKNKEKIKEIITSFLKQVVK